MKKLSSPCMALLLLSLTSLSQAEANKTTLMDVNVPSQYVPITKSQSGESESRSFLDRTSIQLHPYNENIREFIEITNNKPALELIKDDEKVTYQSVITHYYANCDKQELVKGIITSHAGYFGAGEQQSYNQEPRRWELINKGSSMRSLLTIACALPLNPTIPAVK